MSDSLWKTASWALRSRAEAWKKSLLGDTSQGGEVPVLRALLRPDFPKYLVDVGANDGRHLSNSRPFIRAGWHAMLVEPLPKNFAALARLYQGNKRVICEQKALAASPGKAHFFLGTDDQNGLLGSLCTDQNTWFDRHRSSESIEVEVDTLTNLLTAANYARDFSLLLVDAEGMDYEVLSGLDFSRYQPRIIVTEEYPHNVAKHESKYRLLSEQGYELYKKVSCNTIWVRPEFLPH